VCVCVWCVCRLPYTMTTRRSVIYLLWCIGTQTTALDWMRFYRFIYSYIYSLYIRIIQGVTEYYLTNLNSNMCYGNSLNSPVTPYIILFIYNNILLTIKILHVYVSIIFVLEFYTYLCYWNTYICKIINLHII